MKFVKIATNMYPVKGIEWVNFTAMIDGAQGVEVKLIGVNDTFRYTGDFASLAYDILKPLHVQIGTDYFLPHRIDWVDFAANINGQVGVEVRIDGEVDAAGNATTRQYTGQFAEEAYNVLAPLADDETMAAGN